MLQPQLPLKHKSSEKEPEPKPKQTRKKKVKTEEPKEVPLLQGRSLATRSRDFR